MTVAQHSTAHSNISIRKAVATHEYGTAGVIVLLFQPAHTKTIEANERLLRADAHHNRVLIVHNIWKQSACARFESLTLLSHTENFLFRIYQLCEKQQTV